jgi:protein-disulfide isomerase
MRIALLVFLAAAKALAQDAPVSPVSLEQARRAAPRVNLEGMSDDQRGVFLDVAREVFDYAGCQDTLLRCLGEGQKDPHALRMAALVRQLVSEGFPPPPIIQAVERYYASFDEKSRAPAKADNCAIAGKGAITLVEFSDYQCPHCAAALGPLEALVYRDRSGQVRLCSKYFPFSSHPRAFVAAACAEYARSKGKFWELNANLFVHQEALEDQDLKSYAQKVGLNGEEMLKQVYAGKFDDAVEKSRREGLALGVESTPTLFIDGRVNVLPLKPWYLAFTIDDELQWKKEKGWKFASAPQGHAGK